MFSRDPEYHSLGDICHLTSVLRTELPYACSFITNKSGPETFSHPETEVVLSSNFWSLSLFSVDRCCLFCILPTIACFSSALHPASNLYHIPSLFFLFPLFLCLQLSCLLFMALTPQVQCFVNFTSLP